MMNALHNLLGWTEPSEGRFSLRRARSGPASEQRLRRSDQTVSMACSVTL